MENKYQQNPKELSGVNCGKSYQIRQTWWLKVGLSKIDIGEIWKKNLKRKTMGNIKEKNFSKEEEEKFISPVYIIWYIKIVYTKINRYDSLWSKTHYDQSKTTEKHRE